MLIIYENLQIHIIPVYPILEGFGFDDQLLNMGKLMVAACLPNNNLSTDIIEQYTADVLL